MKHSQLVKELSEESPERLRDLLKATDNKDATIHTLVEVMREGNSTAFTQWALMLISYWSLGTKTQQRRRQAIMEALDIAAGFAG